MIYGDKQFRDVYIQTAANAAARASADLLADGEVQAFNVSGTGAAAAGEPFKIWTNRGGEIFGGDIIDPSNILKSASVDYAASANKVAEVQIPASPVVGDSYEARVLIRDWGVTSACDYVSVYGHFVAETTSANDVAAGLAAAINLSLTKTPTAKIVASSSTDKLVITGLNNDFKLFQYDGKPSDFVLSLYQPTAIGETITTARNDGKGEGWDIAQLEHFSKLVIGDPYAASEISYTKDLLASATGTYNVVEISYYSERLSAPGDKQRKVVTIAADSGLTLVNINAQLIAPLNTIFGLADLTVGA